MAHRVSRSILYSIICMLALTAAANADPAGAGPLTRTAQFNIEAQSLATALIEFSRQAGVQILSPATRVRQLTTQGVHGRMSLAAALDELLRGTRLRFHAAGANTIGIDRSSAPDATGDAGGGEPRHAPPGQPRRDRPPEPPLHPAATSARAGFDSGVQLSEKPTLEEVIVTAQKREQRMIDVPVPVTAISGSTLIENGEARLRDYYQTVPGLSLTTGLNGAPNVAIRGLATVAGNPTTSVTVDGIPFGSSSGYGGLYDIFPDIDPSDLARVEVLRGPQGTLYGAASIGGLINYVTVEPSLTQFSSRVEVDLSKVQNAENPGNAVRAAVNLPISDSVAMRISGFERQTPGYIDDVLTGRNGTNRLDAQGGHAALLLRPSDSWSLELSALYQRNEGYGSDAADPDLGDLKQEDMPGTGTYDSSIQAYSAILKARIGAGQLTVSSGYNINTNHDVADDTFEFGSFPQQDFGVGGVAEIDQGRTAKATEEVRLSLPLGKRVDWLLGLFYTHEETRAHEEWWAADPATGSLLATGNMLLGDWPTTYSEYAAFTDVTLHLTSRFDVQFGGRESENRQTYSEVDGGGYTTVFGLDGAPAPLVTPEVATKDNDFTYLVTPQFRISPDVMVYARLATGYRPGGPNPTCAAFDLPCHFDPDRTQDYEIGLKGDVLDHRLDFDASLFYIDWQHIQFATSPPCNCATIYVNAGSARSDGVELSLQGRPASGLTLSGWVDFTDAVLTSSLPPNSTVVGGRGDRLPFDSRFSGNFSAEQDFPISSRAILFLGGQVSYIGRRQGLFEYLPERANYPAYAETSLRGGVLVNGWRVTLFANNVTDRRGILGGLLPDPYGGTGYTYIQPRTLGISAARTF